MSTQKLIARLQAVAGLSEDDRHRLMVLPTTSRAFKDGDYILREGDIATQCAIVVNGFISRQKVVSDRTQIMSFYVPGDIPDLHTLHLPDMDHDVVSVGSSTIAFVLHKTLKEVLLGSPSLTHALWRETLVDASLYREWVATLGARDALARVAHLFCEIATRLEVVGLVENGEFELPLTQRHLADACGLSLVHVNRTLQHLRREGLMEWKRRKVTLLKRAELEAVAEFIPDFLHLSHARQALKSY